MNFNRSSYTLQNTKFKPFMSCCLSFVQCKKVPMNLVIGTKQDRQQGSLASHFAHNKIDQHRNKINNAAFERIDD